MRILRAIVEPATDLLAIGVADLLHRRGIRAKSIGDDLLRSAICLHDALENLQRRSLVPACGDHRLQDLAFMVDRAPEVAELAVDLHEDLIQMPPPLRIAAHMRDASLADCKPAAYIRSEGPAPRRTSPQLAEGRRTKGSTQVKQSAPKNYNGLFCSG